MDTTATTLTLLYQKHFLCRRWDTLTVPDVAALPVILPMPYTWMNNPALFRTLFPGDTLDSLLPITMLNQQRQDIIDSIITVTILDVLCKFKVHSINKISDNDNDFKHFRYKIIYTHCNEELKSLVDGIDFIPRKVRLFDSISNDLHLMCRFALTLDKHLRSNSVVLSCQKSNLIMGSNGSGKRTFLNQFQYDLQSRFRDLVVIRMNGENVLKSVDNSANSDNTGSLSQSLSLISQSTSHYHALRYLKTIALLLGHKEEAASLQNRMEAQDKIVRPVCVLIDNIDDIYLQGCNSLDLDDTREASISDSSVEYLRYNLHRLLALMADPTYRCRVFLIATSRLDSSRVFSAIAASSSNSGAAKYPEFDRYFHLPRLTYRDRYALLLDILATIDLSEAITTPDLGLQQQGDLDYYARKLSDLTRGFSVGELVSMVTRAERLHRDDASKTTATTTTTTTTTTCDRGVDPTSFFEAIVETRAASQRKIRERMSIPLPTSSEDDLTRSSSGSLSFQDFIGYPDIKTQVRRILKTVPSEAAPSLLPQRDEAFAGLIAPMRGVVLHGPVGCGKTFLAKIIASEAKMNFLSVRSSDLLSKYFGDTERQLRALFAAARASSPCVLFFDDFDVLALRRGGRAVKAQLLHGASREDSYSSSNFTGLGGNGGAAEDQDDDHHGDDDDDDEEEEDNVQSDLQARVLSTFLNELDGIQSSRPPSLPSSSSSSSSSSASSLDSFVLVIVACRRLSRIDEALLRPGRLQCKLSLGRPDLITIHEMLIQSLQNCGNERDGHDEGGIDTEDGNDVACSSEEGRKHWLVDVAEALFARRASCAEVRAICTEAIMAAIREEVELECRPSGEHDSGRAAKGRLARRHFDMAMQRLLQ